MGTVNGIVWWMELDRDREPDRREIAKGLREGGQIRIAEGGMRQAINGEVGKLVQFTVGTVEVDDKRYRIGSRDLEPVNDPANPS